jgi:5-methylcytosine-specific restriction protein A
MPTRPPSLKVSRKASTSGNWDGRKSRQARGYGRAHELMRERVLREEPLCYMCLALDPPRYSPAIIADHKVPKSEGGTDDRENYGGACAPCHTAKTARESARGRKRARSL